jgi:hypothetical protein
MSAGRRNRNASGRYANVEGPPIVAGSALRVLVIGLRNALTGYNE